MNFQTVYDFLQADIDLDELLKPILPYLDKNEILVDAGCGSGHILTYLSKMGFKVLGLDIDSSMLSLAQQKINHHKLEAKLFEHDLRKPLRVKAHQIISLLDVSHYFKGVSQVFKNYYQALSKNGVLILDLYKVEVNEIEEGQIENLHYHWEVITKNQKIRHKLTVLVNGDEFVFKQNQYYYPIEYYHQILVNLGFSIEMIDSYDDRKVYLVCQKI